MKNVKNFLSIAVVGLFLSLTLMPVATGDSGNNTAEIGFIDKNGESYHVVIELSEEQLQKLGDSWDEWENYLKTVREDSEIDSKELTEFESKTVVLLEEIKELTRNSTTGQYYFPPDIDIPAFIHDHLFMCGFGAKIFSIGRGRVWLPFNRQGESFIGTRFAPIFVSYSIGYTKVRVRSFVPFSLVVSNRFFMHRLCTAGFTGLYINFGKMYADNSQGPIILIGRPLLIGVSDDII